MSRNALKILLFALSLWVLYLYGESIFILASHHSNTDMLLNYLSGKMLNLDIPGYHFSQEYFETHKLTVNIIPNLAPPFFIMLSAFLARYFNYPGFFAFFMIASLCLNMFALTRLYQHFYNSQKKNHRLILVAFVLSNFIYWPTFMNITFGQVALILNVIVIFFYLSLEKKHFILSGFLLALGINIKLFFGIFLVQLIAKKQWRACYSFTCFGGLFAIIPLFIYGISIYDGYLEALSHIQWYGINWNASWYGFLSRLLGEKSHRFNSLFDFPRLKQIIYFSILITYLAFIYYINKKKSNTSLNFAFSLSSMLLLSPLGWSYYFPFLLTALLVNIKALESKRRYALLTSLLLFAFFISACPALIYQDKSISSMVLITQGNQLFFSLLLFNIVNFAQIFMPNIKTQSSILTAKLKLFVFSMCLFPSLFGVGTIFLSLFLDKPPALNQNHFSSINDELTSNAP